MCEFVCLSWFLGSWWFGLILVFGVDCCLFGLIVVFVLVVNCGLVGVVGFVDLVDFT